MKSNCIELYRFLFTLVICIFHFQKTRDISVINTGYLAVEFFFILSGYLIMQSYRKNRKESAFVYTVKKVRRLYPHYFFSFLLLFAASSVFYKDFSAGTLFRAIPELLMVQNIGIYNGGINYPLWYLSVLVIGGYFIYYLLNDKEKTFINIGAPAVIILFFTYLSGTTESIEVWDTFYCIYIPFFRGIADMCIGVLVYRLGEYKEKHKINRNLLNTIEIAAVILAVIILFSEIHLDYYFLIIISIVIYSGFDQQGILYKKLNFDVFGKIGGVSYAMYLNHVLIISVFNAFVNDRVENNQIAIGFYLIVLIGYSIATRKIVSAIEKKMIGGAFLGR